MKKILSAALAAFMAVTALTATSFADLTKADSSISLKGTTVLPILKVTLPKTLAFVVNPYKMSIDKTTGKAATATTTDANKANTFVVPTYGTTVDADKNVVANTAWDVVNSSGLPISANIYAVVTNPNATKLQILDANNESKDITDQESTAAAAKKQLTLSLKALSSKSGSTAVAIPLLAAAPDSWTATGKTAAVANVPDAGKLSLTLDTDDCTCAKGADCDEIWTTKDNPTLGVFFKFDFVVA